MAATASTTTTSSSSNACGAGDGGGTCHVRIYPKEVIKSVREQMKKSLVLDPNVPVQVPPSMELDETMKSSASWKDAAMVELRIDESSVHEIDVLRSREMVQRHSGGNKYGSICLVVRRPG